MRSGVELVSWGNLVHGCVTNLTKPLNLLALARMYEGESGSEPVASGSPDGALQKHCFSHGAIPVTWDKTLLQWCFCMRKGGDRSPALKCSL